MPSSSNSNRRQQQQHQQQQQQLEEHQRMARERLDAQLGRSSGHHREQRPQYSTRNLAESYNTTRPSNSASMPRSGGHGNPNSSRSSARNSTNPTNPTNPQPPSSRSSSRVKVQHHHDRNESTGSSSSDGDVPRSAKERLEIYNATKGKTAKSTRSQVTTKSQRANESDSDDPEHPSDAMLVQYLALQSYHLPGNTTWKQDWWQFMLNNHPIFGICCHHPLHPIKKCTRVVALTGSVVVGLAITNLFYLFYLWNPQFNQPIMNVVPVGTEDNGDDEDATLTTGMLLLWTVGGGIHCTYNLLQWYIAACACCRPGGFCETKACCPSLGKHLLRVLVAIIISMAVLIILMRVAITNEEEEDSAAFESSQLSNSNNSTDDGTTDSTSTGGIHFFDDDSIRQQGLYEGHDVSEFEFLVGYLVEMALSYFVYYPIGGTILFSGILGCGKIPILGGRPLELKNEERRRLAKEKKKSSRRNRSGNTPQEDAWSDAEEDDNDIDDDDDDDDDEVVVMEGGRGGNQSSSNGMEVIIPVEHYRRGGSTRRFD